MQPATIISRDDMECLIADRSPETQMKVAQKLTALYNAEGAGAMSGSQAAIANDIFQLLLSRAEVQVRAVLARNLSQNNKLPPDIARRMIQDVSEVAIPVLEHSDVLSDHDLLGVIQTNQDAEKLKAIARRKSVSESVSDALVETRLPPVVSTLVQNESATISEMTLNKIIDRHNDSTEVMDGMLQRTSVPITIVEKVIERVSASIRQTLEQKYGNLDEFREMCRALDQSLELTTLHMLGYKPLDNDLLELLQYLDSTNKISPFSSLSMANMQLFEISLSRIIRLPIKNVQILLQDPNGLKALYDRAELPESLFPAVDLTVHAILELEKESLEKTGLKHVPSPFQVMDRMMQLSEGADVQGTDYLYALMRQTMRNNIRFRTQQQ